MTDAQQISVETIAYQRFAAWAMRKFFDSLKWDSDVYEDTALRTLFKESGISFTKDYLVYFRSKGWIAADPIAYLYSIWSSSAGDQDVWHKVLRQKRYKEIRIVSLSKVAKRPDLILLSKSPRKATYVFDAKYTTARERKIYFGDVLRLYVYYAVTRKAGLDVGLPVFVVSTEKVHLSKNLKPRVTAVDVTEGVSEYVVTEKPFKFKWGVLSLPKVLEAICEPPLVNVYVADSGKYSVVAPDGTVLHIGKLKKIRSDSV